MTAPALWLVLDVETSGFIPGARSDVVHMPVVLEAAWTVVDADTLTQVTPLRQRLCAIQDYPRPVTSWPSDRMDPDVITMHERSGLRQDSERCDRLGTIVDLDDLIDEDVDKALAWMAGVTERVAVHFAGAGVARFEMTLLPMLGSRVVHRCHYGPVDTTAAARALGIPKVTEPDPDDGLEPDIQEGLDVERATTAPHRVATDVRAAYRQVRDMRARLTAVEGSAA